MEKNEILLPRIESGKNNNDKSPITEKFQAAYKEINTANNMIKLRLERLKKQSDLLKGVGASFVPYSREVGTLFNMKNLGKNKTNMMNPNLYANQYIDPIYYPLEMPINAEPITLPKIELGMPLTDNEEKSGKGFNMNDLMAMMQMMKAMGGSERPQYKPITPEDDGKKKKKYVKPNVKTKRDWWKIAKAFINMYKFYLIGDKYGKHSNVRNPVVAEMTKSVLPHLESIKSWIVSCMGNYIREMQIFPDLNLHFHNHSGKLTIQGQSQKIMALLKILIIDIAKRSSTLNDIPSKIQELIYKYIREKAYFPKKFLSSFVINRLDFNFYGGTKNLLDAQLGLMATYLIISKTLVQQVMLYPKESFEQFKNFSNIEITSKMLGSILHYLARDAFNNTPPMVKELLPLLNYYRNYHIYNEQVEKQQDIYSNNMVFRDQDEISRDLVPESSITEFFNINSKWCSQMKTLIFQWSCNLARQIKLKYSKLDKNLEKKQIIKPVVEGEES